MGRGVSVVMEEYLTPLTFIFFGIPNSYFFFLPMLSPYLKNLLKPQYSESQIILQFIVQLYHKDFQIIKVTVILSFIGNITKNKTKAFF